MTNDIPHSARTKINGTGPCEIWPLTDSAIRASLLVSHKKNLPTIWKPSFEFFLYLKVKLYKLRVRFCIINIPWSIDRLIHDEESFVFDNLTRHVSWFGGNHGEGCFIGIHHGAMKSRWYVLARTVLTFSNMYDIWFDNILIMMLAVFSR